MAVVDHQRGIEVNSTHGHDESEDKLSLDNSAPTSKNSKDAILTDSHYDRNAGVIDTESSKNYCCDIFCHSIHYNYHLMSSLFRIK